MLFRHLQLLGHLMSVHQLRFFHLHSHLSNNIFFMSSYMEMMQKLSCHSLLFSTQLKRTHCLAVIWLLFLTLLIQSLGRLDSVSLYKPVNLYIPNLSSGSYNSCPWGHMDMPICTQCSSLSHSVLF